MWMLPVADALPHEQLMLGLHPPERLAVVDVATGALRERRLPGGTLCHGPLMGAVLPRPGELYVRSARPGAFWALRGRAAREIDGAGLTLFRSPRTAPRGYPSGAVAGGIVFELKGRRLIWDARTGERRRAPAGRLVAASPRGSAWCVGGCRRLTGRMRARAPRGWSFVPGAGRFSLAGSLLAVPMAGPYTRIAIVGPRPRSVRFLPVPAAGRGALAWSASGDRLYAAADGGLVAWSPADRSLARLAVRLRGEVIDMSTSPRSAGSAPRRPGPAARRSART